MGITADGVTKSFQSASFLSGFLVSESEVEVGGCRRKRKKKALLPGYSRSLYVVFQPLKERCLIFCTIFGLMLFPAKVCTCLVLCLQ